MRDFVRYKVPLIRRHFTPQHIILFGSRACGRATADSDVDVVVVSPAFSNVKWPNRSGEVLVAIKATEPADILCYTPEEFEEKRREAGIVATACEEGIWL